MRVAGDQDVDAQAALQQVERGRVAPGDDRVAVAEADPEVADRDHFHVASFDGGVVEIAAHGADVGADGAQVVEHVL